MGLRAKLVALFFIGFASTCSLGIGIIIRNLGSDFSEMERTEALRLNDQLVRNFKAELEHLNELNTDWADWAGMYAFAETLSPEFAATEVGTGALDSAKLSFVAIYGNDHRRRFLKAAADVVDQESNRGLSSTLDAMQRLYETQGTTKSCTLHGGADGEVYLLCWQYIHRSDGSGEPHGTLLMGRLLNAHILQRIRNQSALDFEIEKVLPAALPSNPGGAVGTVSTDSLVIGGRDKHLLSGRMLDASGKPVFLFHILLPSDIERSGQQITWRVVLVVMVGALLSGVVLVLGVQYLLVRRLQLMEQQLRHAGAAGGWPEQIAMPPGRDEIATLGEAINRMLRVLREQGQALELLSLTDPLTRLANRRAFDRDLATGISLSRRTAVPLSLLVLDVDHFKAYNDFYGHPAGDGVLVAVGQILRDAASRPTDLAARIGGEEFAILLPNTTLEGAVRVATRIHEALAAQAIAHAASPVSDHVTVSAGVTQAMHDEAADDIVTRADRATYVAKNAGRNQTCVLSASGSVCALASGPKNDV